MATVLRGGRTYSWRCIRRTQPQNTKFPALPPQKNRLTFLAGYAILSTYVNVCGRREADRRAHYDSGHSHPLAALSGDGFARPQPARRRFHLPDHATARPARGGGDGLPAQPRCPRPGYRTNRPDHAGPQPRALLLLHGGYLSAPGAVAA